MNKLINPRIRFYLLATIAGVALLANPLPSLAAPKEKEQLNPEKAQHIDLRPAMKQMKLKEGRNVVHSAAGVKLIAEVKGGRVARWTATDDKGKLLPTQTVQKGVTCQVCVVLPSGGKDCYEIDCKDAPPPPKAARQ